MTKKKENAVIGRPRVHAEGAKRINIYLSTGRAEKLKTLGGSKWISKKIDEEVLCRRSQK